jgi:uncharacterized protein YcbX
MARSVATIATTPVKGFALDFPERVSLGARGVEENRRFILVDGDDARLRSSTHAWPCTLSARYDADAERLEMKLPDGRELVGHVQPGAPVRFDYHGSLAEGRVVDGPWTDPLSDLAGGPVRLVKLDEAGRVQGEPVTIVSAASLARLEREAEHRVDPRRFRMLFHVDGCEAHEEDAWLDRRVRLGDAVVRVVELVERCVVTTRDPDSGARDMDTLALLKRYRGTIDLGVRARVEQAGTVAVGDPVELLD